MACLTCGGLGGILIALGALAFAIRRAGLTCGGLSGILVSRELRLLLLYLWACCHEGLEETDGRRRMRRRSGFETEV